MSSKLFDRILTVVIIAVIITISYKMRTAKDEALYQKGFADCQKQDIIPTYQPKE